MNARVEFSDDRQSYTRSRKKTRKKQGVYYRLAYKIPGINTTKAANTILVVISLIFLTVAASLFIEYINVPPPESDGAPYLTDPTAAP